MHIIDGRKISKEILDNIKLEVSQLPFMPVFCDILVGNNPASIQYVNMKKKRAEDVGMAFHNANFQFTITTEELIEEIEKINKIEHICGIILQLPLPSHIDEKRALDAIDPRLDVDALGSVVSEKFYNGEQSLCLPTALACMSILDSLRTEHANLADRHVVVLGQGKLVGKPVTELLKRRGLDVIAIRRTTENKEEILKQADIIISGIGQAGYLKGDMIKAGAVLIDAGTSESGAGIVGDVDLESVKNIASYVSPVPGGVGPVTIAMLFQNVLAVAKTKHG
jgi:methylenetetrahydrofolate dehydrogenase (NADP+)/methenyltetrahydrofolate cyclohydrolase